MMSNISNTTETLPTFVPTIEKVIIIVTLTFIVVVTIFGNLMVVIAFIVEPKLRKEPFNYFILNLAVTDFLVAITAMTFYTIDSVLGYWPFGPAMCSVWIYADYAMTFASVFTLTAISVDRFWSVTWPINYRVYSTVKKTVIMIAIVWVCVFVIWTPPFIGDTLRRHEIYSCIWEPNENREFIIVVDVIGHYLPCALMVGSHGKVFTVLRNRVKFCEKYHSDTAPTRISQHTRVSTLSDTYSLRSLKYRPNDNSDGSTESPEQSRNGGHNRLNGNSRFNKQYGDSKNEKRKSLKNDENKYNKMERKIFITLTYVIICYIICWLPFYITWDITAHHPDLVPPLLYTIMFWMTYINSTINPLIYANTNKHFRGIFIKIFKCMFCRKE